LEKFLTSQRLCNKRTPVCKVTCPWEAPKDIPA
jgi:hypothetical protein